LQEEQKKEILGDPDELVSDGGFTMPDSNAFGQSFRSKQVLMFSGFSKVH
jgi:inositol oxygenase